MPASEGIEDAIPRMEHTTHKAQSSDMSNGSSPHEGSGMNQQTSISALLEQFQSLIAAQSNIPHALPPSSTEILSNSRPVLPQHSIPPLPSISSNLPSSPQSSSEILNYLSTHILPNLNSSALSPNYYGFVTGGTTPLALLADWLVSVYDQNASVHLPRESITTTVEVAALNQLLSLFNLPHSTWGIGPCLPSGGTLTTGATASNILGLALGREFVIQTAASRLPSPPSQPISVADLGLPTALQQAGLSELRILSTLPHSSIAKAASLLGIGRSSIHSVLLPPTHLDLDLSLIEHHASRPGVACILVISAGEVNTGHFATSAGLPLWKSLRALCDRYGVWIHVDGAFGLFARMLEGWDPTGEYEELLQGVRGVELADSITSDGHKLLNVPYDCGIFFTRHKGLMEGVCRNGGAAYLATQDEGDGVLSPLNIGVENSRRWRALPVHVSLMAYGREGYVEMLKRQVGLARRVVRWLWGQGGYQVLPEAGKGVGVEEVVRRTFMIVLFRARDEAVNEGLVRRIKEGGRMYVSGTVWEGRPAARIAVSSWMVDVERDGRVIEEVLEGIVNG